MFIQADPTNTVDGITDGLNWRPVHDGSTIEKYRAAGVKDLGPMTQGEWDEIINLPAAWQFVASSAASTGTALADIAKAIAGLSPGEVDVPTLATALTAALGPEVAAKVADTLSARLAA